MDSYLGRFFDVLPHYLVMLALVFAALTIIEDVLLIDNVIVFFAVVMVIVIAYRPVVVYLGYAPQSWQPDEEAP